MVLGKIKIMSGSCELVLQLLLWGDRRNGRKSCCLQIRTLSAATACLVEVFKTIFAKARRNNGEPAPNGAENKREM
ncbi:hypothetical protein CRP01_39525 [Flavilitoribacter nigricans DSM 23189 = NBRC 102662]|uniref:Uncharacterized protein n=1 Tax=Flavilitoribacter nigricans (strain ATCC 23147 / DSM 23189 / NBRC 102662 / NCIMB 1420 / SS-2) TaxID=1122177 RepID=A0A2D0MXI9_FLAN2|nr:hypothetical protein CRP01_39525 [Flavilitoribacter nigricans DSM 23189 = NBRC 102662]